VVTIFSASLQALACKAVPFGNSVTPILSGARGGCLMDKNKHFIWQVNHAGPTVLALMAAIRLWCFVASATMIYFSALAHGIKDRSVLLALQAKSLIRH
jgi:hypothetical protein